MNTLAEIQSAIEEISNTPQEERMAIAMATDWHCNACGRDIRDHDGVELYSSSEGWDVCGDCVDK